MSIPRRTAAWLVFGVAAALLAACGDDTGVADTLAAPTAAPVTTIAPTTTPLADQLDGTGWVLDTSTLGIAGADAVRATLGFEAGRAEGNGGCNQFFGSYTIDGSSLTFGEIAQTAMGCPGARSDVEAATMAALAKVASFVMVDGTLGLVDATGATLLTYRVDDATVVGDWTVTGYLDGEEYPAPLKGTTLTVSFATDGAVSGSSGCNTFRGTYTVDGHALTISALGSTKMACAAPGVMEQEAAFLAALQSAVKFVGTGDGVVLANAGRGAVVTLRPA